MHRWEIFEAKWCTNVWKQQMNSEFHDFFCLCPCFQVIWTNFQKYSDESLQQQLMMFVLYLGHVFDLPYYLNLIIFLKTGFHMQGFIGYYQNETIIWIFNSSFRGVVIIKGQTSPIPAIVEWGIWTYYFTFLYQLIVVLWAYETNV